MKHFIILILLSAISCNNGQPIQQKSTSRQDVENKINLKYTATFDIEIHNNHKDESGYWLFTEKDGTQVTQYDATPGYVEIRLKPGDLFQEYRLFYPNGSIEEEKLMFVNNGFIKGVAKYYDESGNLVKEENTDLPYKYSWEDIKNFAIEHHIDLYDKRTDIGRFQDNIDGVFWIVVWNTKVGEKPLRSIKLSGKNGKILQDTSGPLRVVNEYP